MSIKYILLLDDDPDEADLLQTAFTDLGLEVEVKPFYDFEGLCGFLENSIILPDMIFLDINLPKLSGIECLKELKNNSRYRDVPVIMYTNSDYEENINQCFELGATVYMKKNTSFHALKRNLQKVMTWNMLNVLNWPPPDRTILN